MLSPQSTHDLHAVEPLDETAAPVTEYTPEDMYGVLVELHSMVSRWNDMLDFLESVKPALSKLRDMPKPSLSDLMVLVRELR